MTLSGRCLCESVTYEIRGEPRGVVNCHCSRCRRHTGHFMAATATEVENLKVSGDTLRWYDATEQVQYGFCGRCGSDLVSIAAGTLTPPTGLKTVAAIYTNYASDYHVFDETIPSHGEDF